MVIESKKKSASKNQKIFSCTELERKVVKTPKAPKSSQRIANLKTMDSAVMQFSSNNNVTRYQKTELMTLKDTKAAKAPPKCQFDPRVISLDILNSNLHAEKLLEEFHSLLPNVSMNSIDPNLINMLETCHKSLWKPQESFAANGQVSGPAYQNSPVRGNSPSFNRRVSWGDQKIQSYDRKNFYDSISTTTMRPPRMGVGSLDPQKSRGLQSNVRSAKGFACSNERYNYYPNNLSAGSISLNETKSSYDGSSDRDHNKSAAKDEGNLEGHESEPEWFSWPASRHDVIDLHGFDEEDDLQLPGPRARSSDVGTKTNRNSPLKMFDEFARYEQRNAVPGTSNSRRPNNYRLNRHQNGTNFNGSQGQRYHNPLMQTESSSSSMNSSGNRSDVPHFAHNQHASEAMAINPFFEMWKVKNNQQENVPFLNWPNPARPQMKTISDIESGMRQNMNPLEIFYSQQFKAAAASMNRQSVPRFFQKANEAYNAFPNQFLMPSANAGGGHFDGSTGIMMPSQEQLEHHTSEIMRNAILRKQSQNERKFRK